MLLKNIIRLCNREGISIAKLERETGISNGTISRWGTSSPAINNVRKIAEFFGVTIDDLVSKIPKE